MVSVGLARPMKSYGLDGLGDYIPADFYEW